MSNEPEQTQELPPLKRALFALKDLRARLSSMESKQVEPIAIIGTSCRFPGGATTPEAFWQLLQNGVDAIAEVPADRWEVDRFYDSNPDAPGKMISRNGGFIDQVDQFDPHFFGISPREAVSLDPQQRLLLETSWEALERAGIAPSQLTGGLTAVYVGISSNDYTQQSAKSGILDRIDPYIGTGGAFSVAAGRLSYLLGLQGPNLAVDTACSSSLVAVHLACQALRSDQANLAIVGGVNLILTPEGSIYMSKARALSPDGRCKTFAADADGYGRGEGCGVVILKRLSEAQANNDNILAVIRGTAVNHDGHSSGLTVPNGQAQQEVIRAALQNAGGLEPEAINYLEAHGTGTPLGDPIEIRAATAVLGQNRTSENPLYLGSVKTNIGHLEAAAGIAGLIKLVLALQHNELPPQLHYHTPSPHIDWHNMPVKVVTQRQTWQGPDRLAGLSSFGFSGTNAHVIVGPAPQTKVPVMADTRPMHLVTLSAQTEAALAAQKENLSTYLAQNPDVDLDRLAYTLNNGRVHFPHRLAIPAAAMADLAAALPAAQGQNSGSNTPKIAFLFTGQGAQLNRMGHQLYQTQPTFRAALDRCDEMMRPFLEVPLLEVMFAAPDSETAALLHQTTYTQPALFAIEYALAHLWRAWGIQPTAVLGHSIGEITAACVAGVLSLEDAITLVAERGRLMGSLPAGGAMAVIFADETAVTAAIANCRDQVAIAAINGPANIVISGVAAAVNSVTSQFEARGTKVRHLTVSHAFHSPLMDSILEPFEQVADTLSYHGPRLRLISNLTGKQVQGDEAQTAVYWRDHIRQPVRFSASVAQLIADGFTHFVEIGPQPTLSSMALRLPGAEQIRCLPSLRANQDDWPVLLRALADLYQAGAAVNWAGFAADDSPVKPLPLPTYPFQRQRYWFESQAESVPVLAGERLEHPLLGQRLPIAVPTYSADLSVSQHGYLADHQIFGQIVLPATVYVEMALAAAADHFGQPHNSLTDLSLQDALILPADAPKLVQLVLQAEGTDTVAFQLFSQIQKEGRPDWQQHAQGVLQRALTSTAIELEPLAALQERLEADTALDAYYGQMADLGVSYGPAFRGVQQLWRGDGEALGRIQLPNDVSCAGYHVHPALLDACLHVLGATTAQQSDATFLPVHVTALHQRHPIGDTVFCYARLEAEAQADVLTAHLYLLDEAGTLLLHIDKLRLQRMNPQMLQRSAAAPYRQWLYEVAWEAQPLAAAAAVSERQNWLILADRGGVGQILAEQLTAQGQTCTLLEATALPTLTAATLAAALPPLVHQVVDLWNLDVPSDAEPTAVQEQILGHTLALVQALASQSEPPRLWLCSRGAQPVLPSEAVALAQTTLSGLVRVIAQEQPELACVQLDLDLSDDTISLLAELLHADGETQVAFRNGTRYVPRLVRHASPAIETGGPVQLDISERGVLDNLALRSVDRQAPGPGEVEIEIVASGLNFRDVLNALGMYPEAAPLGGECAGRITAIGPSVTQFQVGDEVMALTPHAFSTYVVTIVELVAHKPKAMSFTDAAGIPIVFLTAEYALNHLGQMRAGSKVLIHAAAGGVGMAAIQLAQRAGAEVYATASPPKWDTLRRLGIQHIYNSRTLDFAEAIAADTNGAGVQIALNSLAGEFIPKTLQLVADGGHFVEIGRTGTWDDATVEADYPGVHNHVFFLGQLCLDEPQVVQTMLQAVLAGFADGSLQPLPTRVYDITQAVEAFRFMAQARHVGKIVVSQTRANVEPQPDATYLITGGLGSLGLRVARWLAEQGAGQLALVGRSEPTAAAKEVLAEIEALGTAVRIFHGNVAEREAVDRILTTVADEMPPLRGIVHTAGVLDDGLLLNQSWARFEHVLAPKVDGAWHLHRAALAYELDFFVLFSSTSALLGGAGQSNYAAANTFLDGLAHYRRSLGLPAVSINWGAWAEGGMAEGVTRGNNLAAFGIRAIPTQQGLAVLERVLGDATPQIGVLPVEWRTFASHLPPGYKPAFLSRLLEDTITKTNASITALAAGKSALVQTLTAALPDERLDILKEHVCVQARVVLGLDPTFALDIKQPLMDMGLDSLMSVELRNTLSQSLEQTLPASLIFDHPTIESLTDFLLGQMDLATAVEQVARPVAGQLSVTAVANEDPIAIIGLSCRFPGGANTPEAFWQLLQSGVDAVSEVPSDRWDIDAYYDSDPEAPGKMYTRWGGFIEDIDQFDPQFFGISPREAMQMDPQQRLLLEMSWEALERAGVAPAGLSGSKTGVFVGISTNDYGQLLNQVKVAGEIDAYSGTGAAFSIAAGRLSYVLNLQGPNFAVDTACSSSLVALHQAVRSLRHGESNLALVGGVNLILIPESNVYFSKVRAMSFDGRCKTFSAAADGYVRSEGGGVVVLKRLSDARRDGDSILALVHGSAINHDGRSNGLTAPNGLAQQDVIRAALADAGGLTPGQISYVEAHGTGTPLGDPIELQSLAAVMAEEHTSQNPLLIGSVKTNIGHLEAGAGIAGLIKLVTALQNNELPRNLHFHEPNPHVNWESVPLQVVAESTPWEGEKRLAGLSSFGFSGTNAHVIVGSAPAVEIATEEVVRPYHLLTFSAFSKDALHKQLEKMNQFFDQQPDASLMNVAYTTSHGRSHFDHRLAVVADSVTAAREQLAAALVSETGVSPTAPKVAFLFTGQGAQYPGMARQLYETEPVFREAVDQCVAILDKRLERPLLAVLLAEDEQTANLIHQTAYTQPGLFVVEYALAHLWQAWGIKPSAVMGHSIGEITAACIAGVLSLEDALVLVAERGRLMGSLPAGGTMAAIFADETSVTEAIADYPDQVAIAAVNGPQNIVISGTETAVAVVLENLAEQGVQTRRLTVSHAFHSPLMDPILDEFERVAATLTYHKPNIRLISNLTGKRIREDEAQTAVYWRDHIRQPVQFAPSVQTLLDDGITLFLEVGPQPTLLSMARRMPGTEAIAQLASLRRNLPDWEQMLTALGGLYEAGADIDWTAVYQHQPRRPVLLPTYPFQRKRYWHNVTPHWLPTTSSLPETAVFDADEWLYQVTWQQSERPESAAQQPGTWLILADAQGVGDKLAARVQAQGGQCHLVTANHLQTEDLQQWFSALLKDEQPVDHIVYLGGLDAADESSAEAECLLVLHLLQSIAAKAAAQNSSPVPKLWLVTGGAQAVILGDLPALAQSPLWGWGKTIALEHPNLWGGLIDLQPGQMDGAAALLLAEIGQTDGEQQIAWREGQRYVARLTQAELQPPTRTLPLRLDGSYLITGGLGALGLYVAEWLVQYGARRLILLGRTPLPPRREWMQINPETAVGQKVAAIRQLEMAGANVHTAAVDISDEAQLASFLTDYAAEGWPPVRGVVHAAGVLADRSLLNMDAASLWAVFQPKVHGAQHLHTLLQDAPLDFFVLFSSFAAVTGSAGQANYAAANEYLIQLAHYRKAKVLPALVVNWGPWAEAGMAARADLEERRRRAGVASIEPAQGVALLGRFLASDVTAVGVMPLAARQLRRLLPATLSLLADLPDDAPEVTAATDTSNIRSEILDSPAAERLSRIEQYLQQCIADVLRLPVAEIALSRNVMELGLDSIMVMEMIQRLGRELKLTLHPREVFEQPSVQALAAHLDTLYWLRQKPSFAEIETEEREEFEI